MQTEQINEFLLKWKSFFLTNPCFRTFDLQDVKVKLNLLVVHRTETNPLNASNMSVSCLHHPSSALYTVHRRQLQGFPTWGKTFKRPIPIEALCLFSPRYLLVRTTNSKAHSFCFTVTILVTTKNRTTTMVSKTKFPFPTPNDADRHKVCSTLDPDSNVRTKARLTL